MYRIECTLPEVKKIVADVDAVTPLMWLVRKEVR